MNAKLTSGFLLACTFVVLGANSSKGYDSYVYANLQRSRDALLNQQAELMRARGDVSVQINSLQQKLNRLDQYLRQVDDSLRDVNSALDQVR